MAPLPKVAS